MSQASEITVQLISSFNEIVPAAWDALSDGTPLISHAFFSALENSGSVGRGTGWMPQPLIVKQGEQLIGAMPLFLKTNSYGEYVFDWVWADAYNRSGLDYYPKLLSAIPFSPITSARMLAHTDVTKRTMIAALEAVMKQHKLSSAHVLFPNEADASHFEAADWLRRVGGDAQALARLMQRAASDAAFMAQLRAQCALREPRFTPAAERAAVRGLLADMLALHTSTSADTIAEPQPLLRQTEDTP